ncbi:MAG: MBL fold metallo-hydrolase [Synergistaceae bacterium]|nr:MBL fold metallo-hydrolase [Synergistaceae bacterium]
MLRFAERIKIFKTKIFLLAILAIICAAGACSADGEKLLRFYGLDVGQGDSFFFIFPDGKTMLIDAGPEDAGRKIVRYIKSCGVKKIDLLVATHPHSDHIGGMQAVLKNFEIGKIWDSGYNHGSKPQEDFYRRIKKENIPFGRPKRGYSEKFGGAVIDVLAPSKLLKGTARDANNNCIVLRITYGSVSFLMTADMEREQRMTIPALPQSTVLKAAHHGSYNGTDRHVLDSVAPKFVVLSYGKGNPYGYPHKEIVGDIAKRKLIRFDTADGVVKLKTDGQNISYPSEAEGKK